MDNVCNRCLFSIPSTVSHHQGSLVGQWQNPFSLLLPIKELSSLLAEVSHDEAKWNEKRETSAGFRRVSYHACPRVSLTTSDVFVTCDTTQITGLDQSELKMKWPCERPLSWDPITSLWGKPRRRIWKQIFRSLRAFRPAKHMYIEWNLLGFMELLVLLRFGSFLFEEKAICVVTSGQRWMEWFPC